MVLNVWDVSCVKLFVVVYLQLNKLVVTWPIMTYVRFVAILVSRSFIFCMIGNLRQKSESMCFMLIWQMSFFTADENIWLFDNLKSVYIENDVDYSIIFVALLDDVWKAQNQVDFSQISFLPREVLPQKLGTKWRQYQIHN